MWKHIIIFVCTGGGIEIVKLPQAAGGWGGGWIVIPQGGNPSILF